MQTEMYHLAEKLLHSLPFIVLLLLEVSGRLHDQLWCHFLAWYLESFAHLLLEL